MLTYNIPFNGDYKKPCFHILIIFIFFLISGELSTEAINHDTEENSTRRATRRGKYTIYFVHTLKRQNYVK